MKGLARNYFMITSDFIGDVCRVTSSCACPWNNIVLDSIYSLLSVVSVVAFTCSYDVID